VDAIFDLLIAESAATEMRGPLLAVQKIRGARKAPPGKGGPRK
jgi:hypothetical protein